MTKTPEKKPKSMMGRVDDVQRILDLVLDALLRGRLLPSEREVIKRYRDERKKHQRLVRLAESGPRCPACRSPLSDPRVERCPYCSLLLAEVRMGMEQISTKKRQRDGAGRDDLGVEDERNR
jgi:hypothetical protein